LLSNRTIWVEIPAGEINKDFVVLNLAYTSLSSILHWSTRNLKNNFLNFLPRPIKCTSGNGFVSMHANILEHPKIHDFSMVLVVRKLTTWKRIDLTCLRTLGQHDIGFLSEEVRSICCCLSSETVEEELINHYYLHH
jgi:hypothetical protein